MDLFTKRSKVTRYFMYGSLAAQAHAEARRAINMLMSALLDIITVIMSARDYIIC